MNLTLSKSFIVCVVLCICTVPIRAPTGGLAPNHAGQDHARLNHARGGTIYEDQYPQDKVDTGNRAMILDVGDMESETAFQERNARAEADIVNDRKQKERLRAARAQSRGVHRGQEK